MTIYEHGPGCTLGDDGRPCDDCRRQYPISYARKPGMGDVCVRLKDGRAFHYDTTTDKPADIVRSLRDEGVGLDDIEATLHFIPKGRIPVGKS